MIPPFGLYDLSNARCPLHGSINVDLGGDRKEKRVFFALAKLSICLAASVMTGMRLKKRRIDFNVLIVARQSVCKFIN